MGHSYSDSAGIGLFYGQTRVFLTVAADRSLIAKICTEDVGFTFFVSDQYAWARFERIGD